MTRTRQLYLALALIATAALVTLPIALTQTGQFAGAQVAPTEDLTRLGDVPLPDCGNTAGGQPSCTTGNIYFVNYASNLTDSSGAASRGNFDSGALPSGTPEKSNQALTAVPAGSDLWASYVRFDSDNQTDPVNVIGQNYNRVLLVVEDADQVGRNIVIVRRDIPSSTTTNDLTFTYGTTAQEDTLLPIIDDNPVSGVVEAVTIRNDVEVIVALTDTLAPAAFMGAAAETSAQLLREQAVGAIQQPDRVSQVRPTGPGIDPFVEIAATFPAPPDATRANHSVWFIWETPREDNNVVVQIRGNEGDDAFVALAETARGTGRFVGELELVDGRVDSIRDRFVAELNASPAYVDNEAGDARLRVFNASFGDVNGVTGSVLRLPVENEATITASYRDKTGVQGSRNTAVSTTRNADFRTDSTPPVVEITEPVADFATTSRRPNFSGTANDGQSGLQPVSLRLVISNPQQESARIPTGDPVTDAAVNVPRPRPAETGVLGIGFPDASLEANTIRILEGTEDDDSGLYAEDSGFIDGQVRVTWAYRPGTGADQLVGGDLNDTFIPFTAYVQDLAGNVGYADSDEDTAGDQPHEFELDGDPPILIATADNPQTITFTDAPGNPSRNVIVRTTRENNQTVGQTQTGISWDSNQRALVTSQRAIMVSFDDRITSAVAGDFDVDFDTSGFSPAIVQVIVPPSDVSASIFEIRGDNNQVTGNRLADSANAAALANIIRTSIFLVFDSDIPSDDTPDVSVENVEDAAGNEIGEDSEVQAHDGIGPVLTVTLSDGTGSGSDAAGTGSATLTNDNITVTVRSTEAQGRAPVITFSRVGGGVNEQRFTTRTTGDAGEWDRSVDVGSDGRWCIVVTQADDNANQSSTGFDAANCVNADGNLVNGAIAFTYDTTAPTSARSSALLPGEIAPRATYNEQRPSIVIRLREEVEAGTFELRDADDETDLTGQVTTTDNQAFVYRPSADLPFETLELEWRATDLAGNEAAFAQFDITIEERTDFEVDVFPGWNLISFPSLPVDPSINAVFSDVNVTQVTSFDVPNFRDASLRTATRSRTTGMLMGNLTQVRAGGAYWVFVDTFQITLEVALTPPTTTSSTTAPALTQINAVPGLNYVGVVDQSAQQTQSTHGGDQLVETPGTPPVLKTVGTYLSGVNQLRVYTYDNNDSRFRQLSDSDNLTIGQGLLVYIAPDSTGRVNPIIP